MIALFPEVKSRRDKRALLKLLSSDSEFALKALLQSDPSLLNTIVSLDLIASADLDTYIKENGINGKAGLRISEKAASWIAELDRTSRISRYFNSAFFTNSDSRDPELPGIKGALVGTLLTMIVTLLISFPIGVAAALYLE